MIVTDNDRAVMALAFLKLIPPLVRQSLLDEPEFCEIYGLKADATIIFGDSDVSFQRSKLFDAIRENLSTSSDVKVTDTGGLEWQVINQTKKGDLPELVILGGERRLRLPGFAVLSPNPTIRLRSLDAAAADVNLPQSAHTSWRAVLSSRFLEDGEIDKFHSDCRDNPIHMARSIRSEIKEGQSSVSSLVPSSRIYFDRLVGAYDGSTSIKNFAEGAGRQLLARLSAWRPYDGFLFGLLLSSHSALTDEISVEHLGAEELTKAYDFLLAHGDIISQLGAIEVGIRILPERPEIKPYLISLIEIIRDDDVAGSASGFKLLSALFVLVDGELSRTRLFSAEPPFYRRLVSLSHAALIHRQIASLAVEDDSLCNWAFNARAEQYYMQSFADMRSEPRWNPDLSAAHQVKADYFGRIMIAARKHEGNIIDCEIHALILGDDAGSIQSLGEFPRPYLPGPLEGAEDNPNAIPPELSKAIKVQLSSDKVEPSSFIALVNSAMLFQIDTDQMKLAAEVLKVGNYRLANVDDKLQLLSIMNGLALAASSGRNHMLADELRILIRRYRRDPQYDISIQEEVRICLIASASRENTNEWRTFVGEWLTELAFEELEGDDGKLLHLYLQCLCHAVPELWVSCSRADAALKAYNGL